MQVVRLLVTDFLTLCPDRLHNETVETNVDVSQALLVLQNW